MASQYSLRRLSENEALSRADNERAARLLKHIIAPDEPIQFFCECSNLDCSEHIALTAKVYKSLHASPRHFVIKPGHEMNEIERLVGQSSAYLIVEKYMDV